MCAFAGRVQHALDVPVKRPQHADVRVHKWPTIFRGHDDRFAGRLPFRACCADFGSFKMYAAASLSVTIGKPFGGLIASSKGRDHAKKTRLRN
jgi:hypothetical protein